MTTRGRPPKPRGEARPLHAVKERRAGSWSGKWLGRYVDAHGALRQCGRYRTQTEADRAALKRVQALSSTRPLPSATTLLEWHERWPRRVGKSERTVRTNRHRLERYVLPHLPADGDIPMAAITRSMVRDVQIALLQERLSKRTIDNALSSLSAVLGYALEEDLIEVNPALRMRVDPDDPRLNPARARRERRHVPPEELAAFLVEVAPRWRGACLAPAASGVRTQELLGLKRADRDPERQLIFVWQRAQLYGGAVERMLPGTKTSRGVRDKRREELGRWTLFPATLAPHVDQTPSLTGLLFPSPRGRVWGQRNFYRNVWEPAGRRAGTEFTVYDLRHTFASTLAAEGVPVVEIAAYMGHSTRMLDGLDNTTTRHYQHATGQWRERALEAVTSYLDAALSESRLRASV
jgi:integrase